MSSNIQSRDAELSILMRNTKIIDENQVRYSPRNAKAEKTILQLILIHIIIININLLFLFVVSFLK